MNNKNGHRRASLAPISDGENYTQIAICRNLASHKIWSAYESGDRKRESSRINTRIYANQEKKDYTLTNA